MNLIKLFKNISFLSTLIVIIFLTINNQKQTTKLTILIWETPVLSLGTYLAISSGSGFLISYFINKRIVYINNSKVNKVINYKLENENENEETNEIQDLNNNVLYDNTLIERDIKDPSPTINASFRVISKRSRTTEISNNNEDRDCESSDYLNDSDNIYSEKLENYESNNENKTYINDWFDNAYENW